jgi:hypothetical protein
LSLFNNNEWWHGLQAREDMAKLVLSIQAVLQSVLQKGCPVGYRIKTIKIFSTANNKYFLRRF